MSYVNGLLDTVGIRQYKGFQIEAVKYMCYQAY